MTGYDHFLGQVLAGRYTLVSIIGTGECSAVFGAYDKELGKTVALKMLAPNRREDKEAVRRFVREVEVLSLFDHPNIVRILDHSIEGENKFFVMEYIEGITLKKHILTKGALSEKEILFLARPILSALGEVHAKGIVHSDIKPQNIVLVGSGEIKLMDFGISKPIATENSEISKVTVGTVQYVSPEQAEGKPLCHLSDLYSFGVTLYEMATGVLPFVDEDSGRIAAMHVASQPIPPSLICDGVSTELDELILHAMEKRPENRFQSAGELLDALLSLHDPKPIEKSESEQPNVTLRTRIRRLHPRACLAGGLCALLACVLISLSVLSGALKQQKSAQTYIRTPELVGETYISPALLGLDSTLYSIRVVYVSSDEVGGTILAQSPAPDKVIRRKNTPIEITITVAREPLPTLMPNVTYLSEEAALTYLARYGCQVKTVYEPHAYLPNGYVFLSEPRAGDPASDEVTLYISQNE